MIKSFIFICVLVLLVLCVVLYSLLVLCVAPVHAPVQLVQHNICIKFINFFLLKLPV